MISYLHIRNFGIFEDQEVQMGPGLTVFTGETGAGKSMVVDAVMAAIGHRASSDLVRAGKDRAVAELLVTLGIRAQEIPLSDFSGECAPEEILFSREISSDRSYMRINGRISTMSIAQDIASRLVDIHGQQEHHSLLKPDSYVDTLDGMRKDATGPLTKSFSDLYSERQRLIEKMQGLSKDASQRKREIDLLEFQVNEISNAKLKEGEEESLRQEHKTLSSQDRIMRLLETVRESIYQRQGQNCQEFLGESISSLRKISELDQRAEPLSKALEEASYNLEIAIDLLREYEKSLDLDPMRLKQIEERLDLIERLKSKYGRSYQAIREFEQRSLERLETLVKSDEILSDLKKKKDQLEENLRTEGLKLSKVRQEIAEDVQEYLEKTLVDLGMPGARFLVSLEKEEDPSGVLLDGKRYRPYSFGFDRVLFLFSANPGEPPMPLHKVASGGELSRLMLALKSCMAESDPIPSLIFDEIDAGVGGKAGQAIAVRLWELSRHHQVIAVTHLASIAAMADEHYVVTKEEKDNRTFASLKKVTGDERVREIARMLSGEDIDISLEHASSMLKRARNLKNL